MDKDKNTPQDGRKNIGSALAKFQSMIQPALKGTDQSFFTKKDGSPTKYADLNAIIEASKVPKEKCGLAFSSVPNFTADKLLSKKTTTYPDGRVEVIERETIQITEFVSAILMNGEHWLEGRMTIKTGAKGPDDPQALGSSLTYLRRYMQSNMLNIGTADGEDDDGEAVMSRPKKSGNPKKPVATKEEGELGI